MLVLQSRDVIVGLFILALKLCPNNRWGGEGLLGVSIRFCSFDGAEENVWHVLVRIFYFLKLLLFFLLMCVFTCFLSGGWWGDLVYINAGCLLCSLACLLFGLFVSANEELLE